MQQEEGFNDNNDLNNGDPNKKDLKFHERGPQIDENVNVKICDLGNGCWTHFHFTQRI